MGRLRLLTIVPTIAALLTVLAYPVFCQETVYKVLNPRGTVKEVKTTPLAPRLPDLNGGLSRDAQAGRFPHRGCPRKDRRGAQEAISRREGAIQAQTIGLYD